VWVVMPTILLQTGWAQVWAWVVWAWQYVGSPVEVVGGLLIFMRLWRVKGIRKFLSIVTGVAELQQGNLELLDQKIKLLEQQKALTEEQRDDWKVKYEAEVAARAGDVEGWVEALANVQRECDGRRLINDQDTSIIGIYERLHGVPDEVAQLIERRREEAVARARERARHTDVRSSSDTHSRHHGD
jgi:hypothetical protein